MEKARQHTTNKKSPQHLAEIYQKVVAQKNAYIKKGYVVCPECGQEILLIPTLRKMNEAIEAHVALHKKELENGSLLGHTKPITIRLQLARQTIAQLYPSST